MMGCLWLTIVKNVRFANKWTNPKYIRFLENFQNRQTIFIKIQYPSYFVCSTGAMPILPKILGYSVSF